MREVNTEEKELFIHNGLTISEEKALFIQYGSAMSEAMFDYSCLFFRIPKCIGFIAYRIEFKCAIIIGDPICPDDEFVKLTQAFHKYCDELHFNVIYIAASEKFTKLVQKNFSILIEVCEEMIFDPQIKPIFKSHRIKHRMDKAIKHGLTFHEYIPFNKEIENSLTEVAAKWQKALKGPSLYIGHLNFFENIVGKRWFYVKDGENMTAMALISQVKEGWLLKFLITLPTAFRETSEFLMISLLSMLQQENCHFLTKGVMPVDSLGEIKGLGLYTKFVNYIYKTISLIFKFKNRKEYWQRYHHQTRPAYLLLYHPKMGYNEIRALLKVFRMN